MARGPLPSCPSLSPCEALSCGVEPCTPRWAAGAPNTACRATASPRASGSSSEDWKEKTWTDDGLLPVLFPSWSCPGQPGSYTEGLWIPSDLWHGECPSIISNAFPLLKQKAPQEAFDITCWIAVKLQFSSCYLFVGGLLTKPTWAGLSNFWCLPYGWLFGNAATHLQLALIMYARLTPTGLKVFGSFMN